MYIDFNLDTFADHIDNTINYYNNSLSFRTIIKYLKFHEGLLRVVFGMQRFIVVLKFNIFLK